MAEARQQRVANEASVVALVKESPGTFSVEAAALRLQISPTTIRSAVKRGVASLRDHRLYS
jgi:hypothetical protein